MHTLLKGWVITLALVTFIHVLGGVAPVQARIGVGVGTPKIVIEEVLTAGSRYVLPAFTVLNTGDETTVYDLQVMYHEGQMQAPPPREWFEFSPQSVEIAAGQTAEIKIELSLPADAPPSEYFAYLEATPRVPTSSGQTQVGIAAAGKVYFTVEKSSSGHKAILLMGIIIGLGIGSWMLLGAYLRRQRPKSRQETRQARLRTRRYRT